MPLLPVLYVLMTSVSFGAMDLLRKLLAGRIQPMPLVFFVALGSVPAMLVWMLFAGPASVSSFYFLPGLTSVGLNFLANLGFIHSLRLSPLSRTIPLLSLTPVFTSLMAIPLLDEYPSPPQAVGILSAVGGALVLNADQAKASSVRGVLTALLAEKGSLLMAAVALLWSLSVPLDKLAIAQSSSPFHGLVLSVGVSLGAWLALLRRGRAEKLAGYWTAPWLVTSMMVCASLALAFQLLSIQVVLVSLVETFKRAIGSLMAVVLGRLVFGERLTSNKFAAITAMIVGVALILGN